MSFNIVRIFSVIRTTIFYVLESCFWNLLGVQTEGRYPSELHEEFLINQKHRMKSFMGPEML